MKTDLIVPIYVDTNALLDLLASIEGGFSIVEKVTTHTRTNNNLDKSVLAETSAEFGVLNVLNLLKVKLSGSLISKKQQEVGEEKETERYHTYGSLLHRLITILDEEELIKRPQESIEVWKTIAPSDFVEIHGLFRPNPIVDSLQRIDRLMGLFEVLSGFMPLVHNQSSGKKGLQYEMKQIKQMRGFLRKILQDIETSNTRIFIVDVTELNQFHVVVLSFLNYLRDQSTTEISYKEYRLLGKVVHKIEQDSEKTIDLLRGTALGGVGREPLKELWNALNQIEQMNFPQINPEVSGPALEVVPIAIYI